VTVLPATDLFLMGRDRQFHVPRGVAPAHRLLLDGVTCSLATNNVLNPFTPFGDCSLIRMANLYAHVAQIGGARDLKACFDMITTLPARLMNAAHYGVTVGHSADLVVVDSRDPALAVAEVAQPLFGLKRGRRSFTHAAATIHRP
jgi:cytosine deaminase